ncbi:IS3 family transposase [Listeria valentina]|uniref:IS3 family transposase n=1 Tax=Listeria valentina TaxID=2705293 RepID=UPI001FE8AC93|nr:IS3 family transposase [Listeria valentina]
MVDNRKSPRKFDEAFKKSIVKLYESGKTQNALANEYGIALSSIARWVKQYSEVKMDDDTILTARQIKQLQKRNAQLEEENLILKKANCHIHASLDERLKAIHILRYEHSIVTLCRTLKVNRSTYYKRFSGKVAPRTKENQRLRKMILGIYTSSQKRIGAAKIRRILLRDYGISISIGRVYRLMKSMNLPKMSTAKPVFKKNKNKVPLIRPNHLNQAFNPPAPNQVWTSDFSYIPIGQRTFAYLCVILDLFSRKVIAWTVGASIDTNLAITTLNKALRARILTDSVLFHTDQGSQYTSFEFRKFLDNHPIVHSLSKPGYPWDNAVTEAFFKYMKKEELNRRQFRSIEEVRLACFTYIEGFYNTKRPHGTLEMLTPNEKEALYFENF